MSPLGSQQETFLVSRDKDHSLKKILSVVANKENTYWENQGYVPKFSGTGAFVKWWWSQWIAWNNAHLFANLEILIPGGIPASLLHHMKCSPVFHFVWKESSTVFILFLPELHLCCCVCLCVCVVVFIFTFCKEKNIMNFRQAIS